ncbi:MAG: hypothetical protein MJA31_04315 [Clostridia bacterium]|nr:hypothetical protein [Clostridia bacterium]
MNKKILSYLLALLMIFSIIGSVSFAEEATGPYKGQIINVRVEGKDGQHFNEAITITDEETGLDLLKTAIGEEKIDGTDGQYGFFINSLYDESGEAGQGYSTSWGVYTEDEGELVSASTGISELDIDGLDEMLLHIKASDSSWNDLTFIPTLEVDQIDNETILTVKKKVTTYGPAPDYTLITVEENVKAGTVITIDDTDYITDENGKVAVVLEAGNYTVEVSKEGEDYPELVRREFYITVLDINSVDDLIEELREHYNNDSTFTFREALAYHFSSDDISNDIITINQKYEIENNPSQAADYAKNIIGLLAAGENPKNYLGVNYVQTLIDAQKESGVFEISTEGGYATQTVFSVIALDMAEADYNKENALNALLEFQDETTGSFGAVDDTAMCLLALGQHRNLNGVNQAIEKALAYIKTRQSSAGGFGYSEQWPEDNVYSISAVIQGLIAVGEDPLSEAWIKNDNSMLDALLSFKASNLFGNAGANEQAFMAISDLYRGQSMYQNFEFTEAPDQDIEYDFTLTREGNTIMQNGCEAKIIIQVENTSTNPYEATIIIALYKIEGSSKEMVNYIFINETIEAESTEKLAGGFLIPETGEYDIKAMLWDDFENKQSLAEPVTIEVQ